MGIALRPLGLTDLECSPLGLGSAAFGGGGWRRSYGPQDDEASLAVIRHAVETGLNWIDTAPIYGLGHAEEVVAGALAAMAATNRPLVFTKVGLVLDPWHPFENQQRDLRPASIRHEAQASLRRLRTDHIDLYQLHWPDPATPIEDSWGEMSRLVEEGWARFIGVCNFDVALLERAEAVRHVDAVQVPFSAIRRDAGADVIPWAAARQTAVLTYSPLQAGLLTDTFDATRLASMAVDDWRRTHRLFIEPGLGSNLALRDALRGIASRLGATTSALALAWVLAWPGVTGAIVGARRPEQLDDWVNAALLEVTPDHRAAIADEISRTGSGTGPSSPR